jgi:hypothetical protein
MQPARHRSFQMTGTASGKLTFRMWIVFVIGLLPLSSWALWVNYIEPAIEAPTYDYTVDTDAADAEADYLLQTARIAVQDSCRVSGEVPLALSGAQGCGLNPDQLGGRHYLLVNGIEVMASGELQLVAVPLTGDYPVKCIRFLPADSSGELYSVNHPR